MTSTLDVQHKMNPEAKALWLAALRSGEYIQGSARLANVLPDGTFTYCCLGVLCEVAIRNGLDLVVETHDYATAPACKTYNDNDAYSPTAVVEWAGLPSFDPYLEGISHASDMNDGVKSMDDGTKWSVEPHTFSQIADLIDAAL